MKASVQEEKDTSRRSLHLTDNIKKCIKTQQFLSAVKQNKMQQVRQVIHQLSQEDLNSKDDMGNTALHYACELDSVLMLKTLVQLGAKYNLRNHNLETCVHVAFRHGCVPIIYYLVEIGAEYDVLNAQQRTPLDLVNHDLATVLGLDNMQNYRRTSTILNFSILRQRMPSRVQILKNLKKYSKDQYRPRNVCNVENSKHNKRTVTPRRKRTSEQAVQFSKEEQIDYRPHSPLYKSSVQSRKKKSITGSPLTIIDEDAEIIQKEKDWQMDRAIRIRQQMNNLMETTRN